MPPTSTESETLILPLDKYTACWLFFFSLHEMHHSVWVTLHLRWLSTFDDLLQLSNDLFQQIQHNASGKPPVLEKSAAAKRFLLEICVASGWQISNSREQIHSSVVSHPLHVSFLLSGDPSGA